MYSITQMLTEMAQSGSKCVEYGAKSNSLKRRRSSTDNEEDTENIMPPCKQSTSGRRPSYDCDSHTNSSPFLSGDEGCSSVGYVENLDTSAEEYSPQYLSDSHEVSTPLNNLTNKLQNREQTRQTSSHDRKCPLPDLPWANSCDVWRSMCERDIILSNQRRPDLLDSHPGIKLRMRAILLDWLNEVCEAYKLHRETFHLSVNYIDRYLSNTERFHKSRLQLLGITCLFIAAKVEEVYPPKLAEFAYVTDGGCSVDEILMKEVMVLKVLDWKITPMTTNGWLNVYLQLANEQATNKSQPTVKHAGNGLRSYAFLFTQYSSLDFIICAQLIDLALLHVEVNMFKYSQLAAATIARIFNKDLAVKVSGYAWEEIQSCYSWLSPFARVLEEELSSGENASDAIRILPDCGTTTSTSGGLSYVCPNINSDQSHRFQVHNISLPLHDKVVDYMKDALLYAPVNSPSPAKSNSKKSKNLEDQEAI